MSTELLFNSVACNIACTYCMQNFMREAGNENPAAGAYDIDAMLATAKRVGDKHVTLFGGEPLLLPINDLEAVFKRLADDGLTAGIQTNGSIITDRHIEMFKRYNVSVGVSVDGPGELNDARQAKGGNIDATRATTEKSIAAIYRLLGAKISTSVIVTIHKLNAGTDQRLETLIIWLTMCQRAGLKYVNLHTLEADGKGAELMLSEERSIEVMRRLRRNLTGFTHVSPFGDMRKQLLNEGGANCIWNACDPLSTPAVQGIDPTGELHNCSRTYKDGVAWLKGDKTGHERHIALYCTPQEYGGCQGCRFFLACQGGCPGEGIDHDARKRTYHCGMIKALMADTEMDLFMEGKEPVTMSLLRPLLEYQKLSQWANLPDAGNRPENRPHGDVPHGDHTDAERPVITHGDSDAPTV